MGALDIVTIRKKKTPSKREENTYIILHSDDWFRSPEPWEGKCLAQGYSASLNKSELGLNLSLFTSEPHILASVSLLKPQALV